MIISIIADLFVFVFLLWLFGFVFEIPKSIATQKFRNQKSWVWYMLWAIVTAPLWVSLIFIWPFNFNIETISLGFLVLLIFALAFVLWYWTIPKIKLENMPPKRFAAGAVGKSGDTLDFIASAQSVALRLMSIKNNVSVVGIYGFPGFGKSSFARMVIESLPQNEILYTYISLTETNEAKDFSALFAERWFGSLTERYPKIDTKLALPFMQSILRESGNGIISSLFELVPGFNKGLRPTKANVFDWAYPPPSDKKIIYTSHEIANVFGNVPDINEKLWVVMVDEIERARFDEIYRVIEIIERYKNEGRTGMPMRVMFILCVSDGELRSYLQKYESNELSHLIRNFFFGGSKSLTIAPIFLPPVPYENKLQYFKAKLIVFNNSLDKDQQEPKLEDNLSNVYFDTISRTKTFETAESKRLSRVFGLIGFSPRLIDRCVEGLYFTFGSYRKESNISRPKVCKVPISLDTFSAVF